MGLLERVDAQRAQASFPVGQGAVEPWAGSRGHDDGRFSPEEYGNYIVTSNEVFSAIDLRSRLLAGQTLRLYRGQKPDLTEVTDGRLHELLRHVNPHWTANRLLRATESCMGLWGEAYWIIQRDQRGRPAELWWVKPSRMRPVPHANDYLAGYLYTPASGGPEIAFSTEEVIWFRYPNPNDEFSPLSPLAAARLAADVASAGMTANRNLFSQGLQLGGIIAPTNDKVTFSEDQALDLEKMLERRFRGVDKSHRWAVLRFEAQFKGMDVTPKDAEFVNAMNLSARQVWRALGVPSPLLNDGEFATLANLQVYQTVLWEHALVPEQEFLAAELEEQLLPLYPRGAADKFEFDNTNVPALQEAHTKVWDRERGQIEIGALTINEWRAAKGMHAVEWGDAPWMPVNKAQVGDEPSAPPEQLAPSSNGHHAMA